jgi:hypothetical protein
MREGLEIGTGLAFARCEVGVGVGERVPVGIKWRPDKAIFAGGEAPFFTQGRKRSPARRDELTRRVRLKVVPPGRVSHN